MTAASPSGVGWEWARGRGAVGHWWPTGATGGNAWVVAKGIANDRDFWRVDIATGHLRRLTAFGFAIGDFDVSAGGREIIVDPLREESDVVQIDLARR